MGATGSPRIYPERIVATLPPSDWLLALNHQPEYAATLVTPPIALLGVIPIRGLSLSPLFRLPIRVSASGIPRRPPPDLRPRYIRQALCG